MSIIIFEKKITNQIGRLAFTLFLTFATKILIFTKSPNFRKFYPMPANKLIFTLLYIFFNILYIFLYLLKRKQIFKGI